MDRNRGSQSEKLKRRAGGSPIELDFFLIYYTYDKTYSVVNSKQIHLNKNNYSVGSVKIKHK